MAIITSAQALPTSAQPVAEKQPHTVDSANPAVQEAKPETEVMSPKFAALARKEKALREMQRSLQSEREKLKSERDADQQELTRLRDKMGRFTQDPYGILLEQGLTSDQVAALMMNQPNPADQKVLMLEQELKALKAANEQTNNKFSEVEKKQYADAVKQIGNDVKMFIDGEPAYEILKSEDGYKAIVEIIETTFQDEERLMTIEEAVKEALAVAEEEEEKYLKNDRIQKKLALLQQQSQPEAQKPIPNQKPSSPTLSNRMVPSTGKPRTYKEIRERAILAAQGKLTS